MSPPRSRWSTQLPFSNARRVSVGLASRGDIANWTASFSANWNAPIPAALTASWPARMPFANLRMTPSGCASRWACTGSAPSCSCGCGIGRALDRGAKPAS
ncbi:hypothetical protein [Ralstonia solanacearum]|uniref:hypothetical protein n=1 Tax=Ralstonia solanacearum TaxID=305 RepID=UPI001F49993A|nr:hypothetical protein [Ralstonia solanacearum]